MKKLKLLLIVIGALSVAGGIFALWYHRRAICRNLRTFFTTKDFTELPLEAEDSVKKIPAAL